MVRVAGFLRYRPIEGHEKVAGPTVELVDMAIRLVPHEAMGDGGRTGTVGELMSKVELR